MSDKKSNGVLQYEYSEEGARIMMEEINTATKEELYLEDGDYSP